MQQMVVKSKPIALVCTILELEPLLRITVDESRVKMLQLRVRWNEELCLFVPRVQQTSTMEIIDETVCWNKKVYQWKIRWKKNLECIASFHFFIYTHIH